MAKAQAQRGICPSPCFPRDLERTLLLLLEAIHSPAGGRIPPVLVEISQSESQNLNYAANSLNLRRHWSKNRLLREEKKKA